MITHTTENHDMTPYSKRHLLAPLNNRRVRVTGQIVHVQYKEVKEKLRAIITLSNVDVDQTNKSEHHLNIMISVGQLTQEQIQQLKQGTYTTLAVTGKVTHYRKRLRNGIFRDNYALSSLSNIKFTK